jgi:polyhydroxyalkanoate synthesis regulator phasin
MRQWAPGAETGLVQTSMKAVGKNTTVKTHEIDVPTLRLLNELERQIAIETGQWEEKTKSKVEFQSLDEAIAALPTDVLDREIARLEAQAAAKDAAARKPN